MIRMLHVFAEIVILRLKNNLPAQSVAAALNEKYGAEFTSHVIEAITSKPIIKRDNAYLCHELRNHGLSAIEIAEILDISVNTVYYHGRKFPKRPYMNLDLHAASGKLKEAFQGEYNEFLEWVRLYRATKS